MSEQTRARWDQRWLEEEQPTQPSEYLVAVVGRLPGEGTALDVAGGPGRNAMFLARHGLDVTLVDISPVAVDLAREAASDIRLTAVVRDLEKGPFPDGPWDVIICFHYLQRDLFPVFQETLAPGGVLVCEIATERNLERHHRPPLPYLLREGELPTLVPSLTILDHSERWQDSGRHEARLLATRAFLPQD